MIPEIFSRFVLHIYGTLRSAAYTHKAVNHRLTDDCRAWSKYWIVYAFLVCLESVLYLFNPSQWMPLYNELKLAFCIWFVMSAPNGSVWLFNTVVHPFLSMPQVDNFISHGGELFSSSAVLTMTWIVHWLRDTTFPILYDLLLDAVFRVPGFQYIKKYLKKETTCEEKPAIDAKSTDLEETEETDNPEGNDFDPSARNSDEANQMSYKRYHSVLHTNRKFSHVLAEEPRKFDEEVISLYRDTNSDDTTIFTNKDIRQRAKHHFVPKL